ncbi:hypothetical protein QQ020_12765 [Fulvivirgaceae bacterium BMA12]|uniref:Uncharacterized protein n=1 Tax=Agaribacillus aureus TaxID=3051825 RepID=A0ABT8L855_9BACT|nr:hypothetical protein [Fulvivirgaceae bacterium BMA12]
MGASSASAGIVSKSQANVNLESFNRTKGKGIFIIDEVVQKEVGEGIDLIKDLWYIPDIDLNIAPGT